MGTVKYQFPDVDESKLAYRGRRFWIIDLPDNPESMLGNHTKKDADYVFYDAKAQALYGEGLYALITRRDDGKFDVSPIFTHVDTSYVATDIDDIVKTLPKVIEDYFVTCGM